MKKFITKLGMVPGFEQPVCLYCDNIEAVTQAKEPRSHHKSKHILRWIHLIQEIVKKYDVIMERVDTKNNIADSFTKVLLMQQFERHLDSMGIKYRGDWL